MTETLPPLPPMPERVIPCGDCEQQDYCAKWGRCEAAANWPTDGYTADQLRSYAEQVRAEEREACARICDQLPHLPEFAENHDVSDGAMACAAAIRTAP